MTTRVFLLIAIIFFSCNAFADMDQAELLLLKSDYDAAIRNCDLAISMKSASAGAYYSKGVAMLKKSKYKDAEMLFNKIVADFSGSDFRDISLVRLGDISFYEGDFDAAIGRYRKLQEEYPQSELMAEVVYRLGKSCIKANRMPEARFYFQKLQRDFPMSFESKLIDELDDSEFVYSVQVGCFSRYENAEKLVDKLKLAGFDAYVSEKDSQSVFYRVRVGKFKTPDESRICKEAVEKKGYKARLCP